MDKKQSIFYATAGWQLLNGIAHILHGPSLFGPVLGTASSSVRTSVPDGFLGAMQGNYYSAGAWLLVSAFMHYNWANQQHCESAAERRGAVSKADTLPMQANSEAAITTRFMTPVFAALAIYYRSHGEPGAWGFVAITSLLEAACAIIA